MSIHSDNPAHGFQFPGEFEVTAMGPADAGLEALVPALLGDAGLPLVADALRTRPSSGGRYVSVTVRIVAATRADYDAAHAALRAHPAVKWTL
jgi:uncharacterized protein